MRTIKADNFRQVFTELSIWMGQNSEKVHTATWQGLDVSSKPEMATYELEDIYFQMPIATEDLDYHRHMIGPNIPWADDHFEQERVSGYPFNPGQTWKTWPWGQSANKFRTENEQFTHTYAERYWPKVANIREHEDTVPEHRASKEFCFPRQGIRYSYGDLDDVVTLLVKNPTTRAAYLPVWFPEDTGIVHGGRVPCTLGYLFRMRRAQLSVSYDIRSCDFKRHFQDDVYLTIRLLLWVLKKCREQDHHWNGITPGNFTMHIGSLHLFINDWRELYNR